MSEGEIKWKQRGERGKSLGLGEGTQGISLYFKHIYVSD